ncbi:MAG: hypothetical protein Q6373_013355, partial [Candidatus Sigynarchaeota archaeon]
KIGKRTSEVAILAKTGGMYRCEVCGAEYKSKGAVTTHVNKMHLEVALKRIDDEEGKEPSITNDKAFARYLTALKKMQLFLFRAEIDDALIWMETATRSHTCCSTASSRRSWREACHTGYENLLNCVKINSSFERGFLCRV